MVTMFLYDMFYIFDFMYLYVLYIWFIYQNVNEFNLFFKKYFHLIWCLLQFPMAMNEATYLKIKEKIRNM